LVTDDLAAIIAKDGCHRQSLIGTITTSYPYFNRRFYS
jgi:hypothetical protein